MRGRGYVDMTRPRKAPEPDEPKRIEWQPVVVPAPSYQSLGQKVFFEGDDQKRRPGESLPDWVERVRVAAEEAGVVGVEAQARPQEEPVRVPTPPARQARLPYAEDREPGQEG